MSEVERYQTPEMNGLEQWAEKLFDSGNFSDTTRSLAEAFVKVAAGAELGLSPFQSMSGVHIIKGKPIVGAGLLAKLLDREPYSYTVEYEPSIEAPESCTITVFKHDKLRGQARFSIEDAKRAGIYRDNWIKYPSDMLFARTISQAARRYAPGATGTTFYVEGELAADVEVSIPAGVTAKPRTRVTAEVIPPLPEPVENIEGEVMPYDLPPLRDQLKAMSLQERADLYELCDIAQGTRLAQVGSLLVEAADRLGMEPSLPPDAAAILAVARQAQHDAQPDDNADTFQHFAETGQDLHEDAQARLT